MIPKNLWISKKNVDENIKITKQALNNPLVPIGMLATTGCLIDEFFLILILKKL